MLPAAVNSSGFKPAASNRSIFPCIEYHKEARVANKESETNNLIYLQLIIILKLPDFLIDFCLQIRHFVAYLKTMKPQVMVLFCELRHDT